MVGPDAALTIEEALADFDRKGLMNTEIIVSDVQQIVQGDPAPLFQKHGWLITHTLEFAIGTRYRLHRKGTDIPRMSAEEAMKHYHEGNRGERHYRRVIYSPSIKAESIDLQPNSVYSPFDRTAISMVDSNGHHLKSWTYAQIIDLIDAEEERLASQAEQKAHMESMGKLFAEIDQELAASDTVTGKTGQQLLDELERTRQSYPTFDLDTKKR